MSNTQKLFLSILLVLVTVVGRLIPHPWNMTPVGAAAIFAGVYVGKRAAILVPLFGMLIGDIFLGFYSLPLLLVVYLSMVVSGLLAYGTREKNGFGMFLARPIASATLFYLMTNAAVWMFGTMYPHTAFGLLSSFIAGVPFYGHQVFGDILYVSLFFGLYEWICRYSRATSARNVIALGWVGLTVTPKRGHDVLNIAVRENFR